MTFMIIIVFAISTSTYANNNDIDKCISSNYGNVYSKFVIDEDNNLSKSLFFEGNLITEYVNNFCINGEFVYYCSNNYIYSYNLESNITNIVYHNIQLRNMIIYDNYLYGVDESEGLSRLCIIDISNNEIIKTNYTNVNAFTIDNAKLNVEMKINKSKLNEFKSNTFEVSEYGAIDGSEEINNANDGLDNLIKNSNAEISMFSIMDTNVPVLMATVTLSSLQPAMFVMDTLYVTQGGHNEKTNYTAFDFDGSLGGTPAADVKAPFNGTIKYKGNDSAAHCHAVWFESNDIVQYADGTTGYMTIVAMHDEDISDLDVGDVFLQGKVFYQEGNYGISSGQHLHLECIRGKAGSYVFQKRGNVYPNDALYLYSNTNVQNKGGYTWRMWTGEHTHSYSKASEAAHPHREYMICSCGNYYYTGNEGYKIGREAIHPHKEYYVCGVDSCSYNYSYTGGTDIEIEREAVHPHKKYYVCGVDSCSYNYSYTGETDVETGREVVHPHKKYYVCGVDSCSYNYSYTGEIATTTEYEDTYPYKEYYVCSVTNCSYHNTYTGKTAHPGKPSLKGMQKSYYYKNDVTFSWDPTENTTHYSIYFDVLENGEYTRIKAMHYVNSGMKLSLEPGKYRVFIQSSNSNYKAENGVDCLYENSYWFYFTVFEKETAYTFSTIHKNGNTHTIYTEFYNLTVPYEVIVAGYKDKQFVSMTKVPVLDSREFLSNTLVGDIDEIKVMVWDSLITMIPLCEADTILSSEFVVE